MKHAKTKKPAEQQLPNFRIIKYFKMGKAESYQAILFYAENYDGNFLAESAK